MKVRLNNAPSHGMYYMPSGAGDMVFYAEACYYTDTELTESAGCL